MDERLLFVRASITPQGRAPIEARFEIDSGSTGAILLNTPFVESHKLLATAPKLSRPTVAASEARPKMLIGRVNNVRLGRFVIDHPITPFSGDRRRLCQIEVRRLDRRQNSGQVQSHC